VRCEGVTACRRCANGEVSAIFELDKGALKGSTGSRMSVVQVVELTVGDAVREVGMLQVVVEKIARLRGGGERRKKGIWVNT